MLWNQELLKTDGYKRRKATRRRIHVIRSRTFVRQIVSIAIAIATATASNKDICRNINFYLYICIYIHIYT